MCARLLAQQGYSVVLIEAHTQPGDQVNCSGVIGMEAFQHFELPEQTRIRTIDSVHFYSPSGKLLKYNHPRPLAHVVDRSAFDYALAMDAVSAGATLKAGSRVSEIRLKNDWVELFFHSGESVRSKFVVIATGAGSSLCRQVGLGSPQSFVLGVQAVCEGEIDEVEILLGSKFAPSNFAWTIPLQPGYAKVGLICQREGTSTLQSFLDHLKAMGRIRAHDRILCSALPLKPLERSYSHRTIVIGEAAGQIKTITCGGIYYGLLAAEIGSQILHDTLQRKSRRADSLSEYETRWKTLLLKELKIGLRFRTLFEKLSDSRIDSLFEIAEKDGIMRLIQSKVDFDWHSDLVSSILRHTMVRALLKPALYKSILVKS